MQQRSIPMYIILSIVTCGLFGLYWFIVLTDETNEVTGQTQLASGPMALILALSPVTFTVGTGLTRWVRRLI